MKIVVKIDRAGLDQMLSNYPARLARSVLSTLDRLSIMVQARVKEKLSGEVLHVRTGTLRRSINRELRVNGGLIEAIVGTNVEYAATHEYGFSGTVSVREHVRRITTNNKSKSLGKMVKYPGRTSKNRFVMGSATVSAHSRNVNIPERSFLRSTLIDFKARIEDDLQAAAKRALT